MGHTKDDGIGNRASPLDDERDELIAEIAGASRAEKTILISTPPTRRDGRTRRANAVRALRLFGGQPSTRGRVGLFWLVRSFSGGFFPD